MSSTAEQKTLEEKDASALRSGHASALRSGQAMEDVDDSTGLHSGQSNKRKELDDSNSLDQQLAFKRRKTDADGDGKDAKFASSDESATSLRSGSATNQRSGSATSLRSGCGFEKWRRPPVSDKLTNSEDVHFTIMDIDVASTESRLGEGKSTCPFTPAMKHRPVFHVHGVTNNGHSISTTVHDFYPYLLVSPSDSSIDLVQFRADLEAYMRDATAGKKYAEEIQGNRVLHVELETDHKDILFYKTDKKAEFFIKITLCLPTLIPKCREILTTKSFCHGTVRFKITYESNVKFFLRFLINKRSSGCSWVTLPAGSYWHVARPSTRAQIEVLTRHDTMVFHSYEESEQWSRICPLRILSFDIECKAVTDNFPQAHESPIINICSVLKTDDGQGGLTYEAVGFGWPKHGPITRSIGKDMPVTMLSSEKEVAMLEQWRDFLLAADPDIITGYNIINFDLPYLIERAAALKRPDLVEFGRRIGTRCQVSERLQNSKAHGQLRNKKILGMHGRILLDPCPYFRKTEKFRSYKLDAVATEILEMQKAGVHHTDIKKLHDKDEEGRTRVAHYCFVDALLGLLLCDEKQIIVGLWELARLTGVTLVVLLEEGQQIKGFTAMLIEAANLKYHIPTPPKQKGDGKDDKYKGAFVLDVEVGYYEEDLVGVLDFNSLYPTIMVAYNLSYDSYLPGDERKKLSPNDYHTSPDGKHAYIKKHVGLLAMVQEKLLASRKRVKELEKKETNYVKKATLTARQLAIKLVGNSLYGFTGAKNGLFALMAIAETVTGVGRDEIMRVKKTIESHFTRANGYPHDAKVVGGDTDSVFTNMGKTSMEVHAKLMKEAQDIVNADLKKRDKLPMKMEHEKTLRRMLLLRKKGNAALKYEPKTVNGELTMVMMKKKNGDDYVHTTGLVSVRRDNCLLNSEVNDKCIDLLVHGEKQRAIDHVKQEISDLMARKTDLSRLVISCGISKETYAVARPSSTMRDKLTQRADGDAPRVGDRLAYIVVQGRKEQKLYERVEDPLYAVKNQIPYDPVYYRDQQLRNPLTLLFTPVLGSEEAVQELFEGPHTRQRAVASLSKSSPLAGFLKPSNVCVECGVKTAGVLCRACKDNSVQVIIHRKKEVTEVHAECAKVWQGCYTCAGGREDAMRCSNTECDKFFKRITLTQRTNALAKKLCKIDPRAMDLSLDDLPTELF